MKLPRSSIYPRSFTVVTFTIWAAVSLRWIIVFVNHSHPNLWLLTLILGIYGILVMLHPLITKDSSFRSHMYLVIQTVLIISAMLLFYELDFFALLFLPLGGQAIFLFPRRTAFVWNAIFGFAIVVGQFIQFGRLEGLSFSFLYLAALLLIASFSNLMLRANEARLHSDQLLEELQQAHRKLQEYAGQTEELAIAKERNRLARELHDSVAQTLYGLTLQAEAAARKLKVGQIDEVTGYLREIRDSSQQTLKETRLLIFELRSPVLEREGLIPALQARLGSVESRSGLKTQIDMQEVGRLPGGIESGLYGIANEVLNNILKHAHASEINVSLEKVAGRIVMEICDNGTGFDLVSLQGHHGLGLKGMKERAEQLGGELMITSGTNGTQVIVEIPYE